MNSFLGSKALKLTASAAVLAVLSACGGGGGDGGGSSSGAGATVSVTGTAARGAVLPGAAISMTCANGAVLSTTTTAAGTYTATATIAYPCIGSATLGAITYRGVLFSGSIANFTPLTDLLVEAVLAASAPGSASLSLTDFIARVRADSTFATSVTASTAVAAYRSAVLSSVRAQLIASGSTPAQADSILGAAATFDATAFLAGSALDIVLDNTGAALLNANGTVKALVIAAIIVIGNTLPAPATGATGATGGTSR